jgi:N-acetyl-anhydromuramyl-L-alanine amidase AmpD
MWRALLISGFVFGSLAISATPAHAEPPSYYPALQWVPAAAGNYEVGRARQGITAIVIHETDSSFSSALYSFGNPRSRTSSHYLVRASDGVIAQTVAESDTAYHARSANRWTIGIEHEFWPRYAIWHTDAQYRSSARLVCAIARRYGIPLDRAHIVGHNELPGNDHSDPGPTWNWTYYMSLVRACDPRAAQAAPSTELPARPNAELAFGDVSADVALLQWGLAYLGHMPPDEVVGGGWRFGTVTEVSLRQFQSARGLPATGRYGDSSASALAQALEASPSDLPTKQLEVGAESDEVARLQTALETLGYIDRSTGYFGPMTSDAVARFQSEHGIDATGIYDAVTRIALAAALRSGVPQGSELSAFANVQIVE